MCIILTPKYLVVFVALWANIPALVVSCWILSIDVYRILILNIIVLPSFFPIDVSLVVCTIVAAYCQQTKSHESHQSHQSHKSPKDQKSQEARLEKKKRTKSIQESQKGTRPGGPWSLVFHVKVQWHRQIYGAKRRWRGRARCQKI